MTHPPSALQLRALGLHVLQVPADRSRGGLVETACHARDVWALPSSLHARVARRCGTSGRRTRSRPPRIGSQAARHLRGLRGFGLHRRCETSAVDAPRAARHAEIDHPALRVGDSRDVKGAMGRFPLRCVRRDIERPFCSGRHSGKRSRRLHGQAAGRDIGTVDPSRSREAAIPTRGAPGCVTQPAFWGRAASGDEPPAPRAAGSNPHRSGGVHARS